MGFCQRCYHTFKGRGEYCQKHKPKKHKPLKRWQIELKQKGIDLYGFQYYINKFFTEQGVS
jgi:hypothetical protein